MKRLVYLLFFINATLIAQEGTEFSLPDPDKTGGMPLMETLNKRQSSRDYIEKKLSKEQLSNLLWAGFGINRPDDKNRRTAPSARNFQEIDIYVCVKEGVFIYQPISHSLKQISNEDVRKFTGTQKFPADAPVNLVFVADYSRLPNPKERQIYAYANTGFISQNVYLYCASEGLGTVVRGLIPREELAEKLSLKPDQEIILAQTVGYAKE